MTRENIIKVKRWYQEGKLSKSAKDALLGQRDFSVDVFEEVFKISIVIITHNREKKLLRTIKGIKDQEYKNYEIIIIDDASTDNTCTYIKKLKDPKITYIQNELNIGASESRRKGYSYASGDILIFSDDDDYYIDNKYFSELNRIFCEEQDCVMVCASSISHFELEDVYYGNELNFRASITSGEYLRGFNTVYDKPNSSFALALNMNKIKDVEFQNLKCFNDTSLYLYALLAKGNVEVINRFVGIYRVHSNNMSGKVSADFILDNLESKKDIYEYVKKANLIERPEHWLLEQAIITMKYYFISEINEKKEDIKILIWANKTFCGINKISINLFLSKYLLKNTIKRTRERLMK